MPSSGSCFKVNGAKDDANDGVLLNNDGTLKIPFSCLGLQTGKGQKKLYGGDYHYEHLRMTN